MKRVISLFLIINFVSCKSAKHIADTNVQRTKINTIILNAKAFKGTKYKYGGTTKKGMDCSGLIYTSFKQAQVTLPRISRDMATKGKLVSLNKVRKGDLLFFATTKKNSISHVGLVTRVQNNAIYFIHASSKRGVVISSMNEPYYKKRFVKAKRILD